MPQSSSQTPSGAKKPRDKSSKSSTESKLELLTSTNSITKAVKTESDQNTESQSVPNPKQGMFARFMRQVVGEHPQGMRAGPNNGDTHGDQGATNAEIAKTTDQQSVDSIATGSIKSAQPGGHRNGSGIAACSNRSEAVVKVEDTPSQETIRIRDYIFQGGNIINRNKNNHQTKQHVHGDIAIPHSSFAQRKADIQRNRGADDSLRRLNSQEEQNGVTMDKLSHDGVSRQDAETSKDDEMKDADESTISADTGDAMEKSHQRSEEKGKHKHSRKRSKSRGRSKSPKRRKVSETFVPNHLREDTESSSDEEESLDGFDVEQARARLPKGCSVRHEGDQKEELKDGKRFSKSIKFTNIMVSTLKDHQTTLFSWMVKREKENPRQACGGIVGDEMGLGKTVISLACIAANQPTKEDQKKYSQATLVVVPARRYAIQWRDEAIKHWTEEASSRVAIYNPNSDWGPRQYEKQLIVIATYPQLRNHHPNREITKSLCDQYPDDGDSFDREFRKEAKDLLRIKWFRVILDEGHGATKWNGRTLESCCAIQAKHRWVLTGTPIQNTPIEYYSYATFICCRFLNSRRVFRNEFIVKNATNDDFDTLNSYLMYRRTSNEKLDIPPTTHREVYVEVSREEDMICKAINNFYHGRAEIHQRKKEEAQMPIFDNDEDEDEVEDVVSEEEDDEDSNSRNKEPRTRSIQTSKQLRLRQALSHPYCLEKFLLAPNRLSEDELKSLASDLNSISEKKTMIEQLEADEDWEENLGRYKTGVDVLKSYDKTSLGGVFDMSKLMDLVLLQRSDKESKCCGNACKSSQDLSRFKCGHVYCGRCLVRLMIRKSKSSEAERSGRNNCSMDGCGEELLDAEPVTTMEMMAAEAEQNKDYVEIGRDSIKTTVQSRMERSLFFTASSMVPEAVPPPSSKVTAAIAVAMTWLKEAPQDKIIIFTQFIPTLKVLGYHLDTLGVKFVYYSGSMLRPKQEHAMNAFQDDPKTMVLLSTLKSGGQSHNLTVANRVIIVDLWWNKTAEKQAVGRVARMGQKKETYSVRIVTKHGMDGRVIEVQKGKERTVARMLQDDGHVRTEVDDKRLKQIFEPKPVEQANPKKQK